MVAGPEPRNSALSPDPSQPTAVDACIEARRTGRTVAVSSVYSPTEADLGAARDDPTYQRVYRAFAPLLRRWGQAIEVSRPESRLDYILWRAQESGSAALHLSILPLQATYLSARARNVAFPLWSLPDIPRSALGSNPRTNWAAVANRLALLITAAGATRDAFLRAGVTTPIHVVPVPVGAEFFAVPPFERWATASLEGRAYPLSEAEPEQPRQQDPWRPTECDTRSLRARALRLYRYELRPYLPEPVQGWVARRGRSVLASLGGRDRPEANPPPPHDRLELSGVVYTTYLDPFDERDAWQDLLSAFLLALGDREDATLVVRLPLAAGQAEQGLRLVMDRYHELGIAHRCRLVLVPGELPPGDELALARASAYYVNAVRAASVCLPLQEFLAAGRPAISPAHTAMADYFDDSLGFRVEAHPEPTGWPGESDQRCRTRRYRLVWQSLFDQLRLSYVTIVEQEGRYRDMAARAREAMEHRMSEERVWPLLCAALDAAASDVTRSAARRHSV